MIRRAGADVEKNVPMSSASSNPYRDAVDPPPLVPEWGADEARARSVLSAHLMDDEEIAWMGRPPQGFKLRGSSFSRLPIALFWLIFAAAWDYAALVSDYVFPYLFGAALSLLDVYLFALVPAPDILDARARARTFYGVTNRRVFVARARTLTMITLDEHLVFSVDEKQDGSGTIWLGPRAIDAEAGGSWWRLGERSGPPALQDIANVRDVERLMLAGQQLAREEREESDSS
jgi:hypothetical protein